MKLWIVGKRGLLASAMQRECARQGIDHIATSRKEVDLNDEKGVEAQFATLACTHVINCAGYTAVDRAEEEQEEAYALNAHGVGLLAKYATRYGKRLIHFSTDYVFDGMTMRYTEEHPPSPLSVYGKSKEEGERLLRLEHPQGCLIRTSWLFGKGGSHFVNTIIQLLREQEHLHVVADQWGRPTYAEDLAKITFSLLDASGIYHFANSGETTWYAFAEVIKKKLEAQQVPLKCHRIHPVSTQTFGAKALRPLSSILETKILETKKGPPPHWENGLDEVIAHALATQ